jgi:hypothetical protein
MGVWLQPSDLAAVMAAEVAKFTVDEKKNASSSQPRQVDFDHFFDIQGIFQNKLVPHVQTVNGKFYCEVLMRLREGIRRKRQDKWKNND